MYIPVAFKIGVKKVWLRFYCTVARWTGLVHHHIVRGNDLLL